MSLSSSAALLLLYDVTNKASFDNIRVRTTLGFKICLPYLSFLFHFHAFHPCLLPHAENLCLEITLIRSIRPRHLNQSCNIYLELISDYWGKKKNSEWILMPQPTVKPSISFGHECGEVNRDWGYKQ